MELDLTDALWIAGPLVANHRSWWSWCVRSTRQSIRTDNWAHGCHTGHSWGLWRRGGPYVRYSLFKRYWWS